MFPESAEAFHVGADTPPCDGNDTVANEGEFDARLVELSTALEVERGHRRDAEAAFRKADERWRALTRTTFDYILVADRVGTIRFLNRDAPGAGIEQVVGTSLFDYVPTEHHGIVRDDLDRAFQAVDFSSSEIIEARPDGDPARCMGRVGPVERDGEGVGFAIIARRRAEEAQPEGESILRDFYESAPMAMGIVEIHGDDLLFVSANRATAALLGVSPEDLRDRFASEVGAAPEELAYWTGRFRESGRLGGPVRFEWNYGRHGVLRRVASTVSPISDDRTGREWFAFVTEELVERKRAEDTLARDALLLASVRDSVIVTDLEGIVTYWNAGATRLFGWTAEEMRGRHYADRFPEAVRSWIVEEMRSRAGGTDWSGEYEDYRKDGSRIWIDARINRITDASGRPLGLVGVAYDVGDRKRAEQALRESEEQVRLLLDSTGEAIYGVDPEGRCTFCNTACLRLLGYGDARDLLGEEMYRLVHHTPADETPDAFEARRLFRALEQGEGTNVDDEVLWRADGTSFPAEYWSYPVRRGGAVVGAVVTFVDISERRREEAELRTLHSALENAVEGIARLDTRGRYLSVNRAYAGMLGYRPEELIGMDWQEAVHPKESGKVRAIRRRMLSDERSEVELLGVRKDHSLFWKQAVMVKVRDEQGEWTAHYCFMKDITDRKRAEKALRGYAGRLQILSRRLIEAQEAERRRIALELHDEIGQALTALKMNIQAAQATAGPGPGTGRLEESLEIIARTIGQVRDLSLDLRPSMLDDLGLVAALRWYLDRQAQRVGYRARFAADPDEIQLDPAFRVAQEALTNVARHAHARRVEVMLRLRDGALRLAVRDDGAGFDPGPTLRRGARGEGLGLLGMRERATQLGGRVAIRSSPGRGTVVRLTVPVARAGGGA